MHNCAESVGSSNTPVYSKRPKNRDSTTYHLLHTIYKKGFTHSSPKLHKIKLASPAFTIVELLVVIVVIGILAAITIVSYAGIQSSATKATLVSDLNSASTQLKLYQVLNSGYPTVNGDGTPLIDCASSPAVGSICLKPSNGNTFNDFKVNNSTSPQTFCMTVNNGTNNYRVTNDSAPVVGTCSGDSCQYILNNGLSTGSGVYWINPSGSRFQAYCDMTTDGGGWTLVYRRLENVARNLSYNYTYDATPTWGTDYSVNRSKYTTAYTEILVANYADNVTVAPANATKITGIGTQYYAAANNTITGVSSKTVNIIGTKWTCLADWNWGGYLSNAGGYASPSTNTGSRGSAGTSGGDGWGFTESSYGIYAIGNAAWHGATKVAIFIR